MLTDCYKLQSMMLLNLDCLGNKDRSSLLIVNNDSNASQLITSDMMDYLQSKSISVDHGDKAYMSDHISFEHGITLTTLGDIGSSNIHKQNDTKEDVDIDYLLTISKELANYISREMAYQELVAEMTKDVIEEQKQSTGSSDETNESTEIVLEPLSLEEFETLIGKSFGYKENHTLDINISSYRAKTNGTDFDTGTDNSDDRLLTIRDIRSLYYTIDGFERVRFSVYAKDIEFEMLGFSETRKMNQWEEDDLEFLVSIDNMDYYITDLNNGSRDITSIYENEEYIIFTTIYVYPMENSVESYKQHFMESIPSEYISKTIEVLTE